MLRLVLLAVVLLMAGGSVLAAPGHASDFFYVSRLSDPRARDAVVVDTRPLAACTSQSLPGAQCLPPREFLGPHHRLASFRDIVWVLGAAGLSGRQTAVVVGDDPVRRDFVAGVLYLAGQSRVAVFSAPLTPLVVRGPAAPGTARGMFRNPVYQGEPRAGLIVLREELARALRGPHPPYLLDGRGLAAYWGQRVSALRGGHLPGAQPLPMSGLRLAVAAHTIQLPPVASAVVYANDAYDSIAFFTLLRAGGGFAASVFPGGWVDWADHSELPVDSETYAENPAQASEPSVVPVRPKPSPVAPVIVGLLAGFAGYYIGRKRS